MSSEEPSQPAADAAEIPGVRTITDVRALRALTHPVRIALLEALLFGGPLTATEVGEQIGETATTCSFHLRQLAKYGFVTEAGGGRGRARPWRLSSAGMSLAPSGEPEAQIASEAVLRLFRDRSFAHYEQWRQTRAVYPREWRDVATDSEFIAYLTQEEFKELNAELTAVIVKWFRLAERLEDPAKRPPGALPVETLLFSYPVTPPAPGSPGAPAEAPPATDASAEDASAEDLPPGER